MKGTEYRGTYPPRRGFRSAGGRCSTHVDLNCSVYARDISSNRATQTRLWKRLSIVFMFLLVSLFDIQIVDRDMRDGLWLGSQEK